MFDVNAWGIARDREDVTGPGPKGDKTLAFKSPCVHLELETDLVLVINEGRRRSVLAMCLPGRMVEIQTDQGLKPKGLRRSCE